ncbi:MAG: hypothetical protein EZS28_052526, partial [Streblomastix strix]
MFISIIVVKVNWRGDYDHNQRGRISALWYSPYILLITEAATSTAAVATGNTSEQIYEKFVTTTAEKWFIDGPMTWQKGSYVGSYSDNYVGQAACINALEFSPYNCELIDFDIKGGKIYDSLILASKTRDDSEINNEL